jgi:hypothetical protein
MVSKFLIISLVGVGAVAAYDAVSKPTGTRGAQPPIGSPRSAEVELRGGGDRTPDAASRGALDSPLSFARAEEFDVISERTLFAPSRRPPVAAPPPAPVIQEVEAVVELEPAPDPSDVTLLGIVVSNDDKVALLQLNKTSETLRLRSGESLAGWTVAEIGDRNIQIEQRGSRFELELFKNVGGATPARE